MARSLNHLLVTLVILVAMTGCGPSSKEILSAVESGDLAKVKELVEANPKLVHVTGNSKLAPLDWAVGKGHEDIALYLIEKGADVNHKSLTRETALDLAKRKRLSNMVKLLEEHGAKTFDQLK
jgi:ankyrin repeat protein